MHIYNNFYGGNGGGEGVCVREIHVIHCIYKTAKDKYLDLTYMLMFIIYVLLIKGEHEKNAL